MRRPAALLAIGLVALLGISSHGSARAARAGTKIFIVADRETRAYRQAVDAIEAAGHDVKLIDVSDPALAQLLRARHSAERWLALGPNSAKVLAQVEPRARAALFVRPSQVPTAMPAVTLEVPYLRQLRWMRHAFPGRQRLVVLRKPKSGAVQDSALRSAADSAGFELVLVDVNSPGHAVPAFEESVRQRGRNTLLWMLPDPTAISTDTVAPLVQTALAARVPVVGFSDYFLKVGALAAIVVDYGACGLQALDAAVADDVTPQAPHAARLVVDGRLAERLGIAVAAGAGVEIRR